MRPQMLGLMSRRWWATAESVTEGHPDKLCDRVSDAILDAVLEQDPQGRVACETFATHGRLIIGGEISADAEVDYEGVARATIRDIGYDRDEYGFTYRSCPIDVYLHEQSADIAQAVIKAETDHDRYEHIGAGDQGIMYGYACRETSELMPLPITLAHALTRRLARVRKQQILSYLRPDGKAQVTVQYQGTRPIRAHAVILSAQHDPDVDLERLQADLRREVVETALDDWLDDETEIYVNPSGRFVLGGPEADTGLTGRKVTVDTYGGSSPHGGGAFSGKDPTKVDRSAAYMARHIAKNVVGAGLADWVEIKIAYAIGRARPVAVNLRSAGGSERDGRLREQVLSTFDLRPAAIIEHLGLGRPIYARLSAYGHFGRPEAEAPWERCDHVETLRGALARAGSETGDVPA